MANTSIDLVGLDFASLKDNLKTYLKSSTQFKDIDYTGSNINLLLDLLAYNTYLNGFYVNMVASEMFLDTAQLRDSVVSHAKELSYTPRSFVGAKATVQINIKPIATTTSVFVPARTSFTTRVGSNTYTFSTDESVVTTTSNNGVFALTAPIYEGSLVSESFVLNYSNSTQRFIISNPTVDVTSINATIYEDGGQSIFSYKQASSITSVTSASLIYFVQSAENQQYELKFGDDVFGRKPKDGATVSVNYRACSGQLPNGASVFVVDGPIDGHANVIVTTLTSAIQGATSESIESIRYNAPRNFQVQDRAVTAADYETLLKSRFPDIQAISVYGGEEASPPEYGTVLISVDVNNADGASVSAKQLFKDYISTKTPLTIAVRFVDPEFMYVHVDSVISYNIDTTTKTSKDIESLASAAISSYSYNNLEDFKTTLVYSNLTKQIDAADTSIIGNETRLRAQKNIIPTTGAPFSSVLDFQNPLVVNEGLYVNSKTARYGYTITSSSFMFANLVCSLADDGVGNIVVITKANRDINLLQQIGTINYETGKVVINNLQVQAYTGNAIKIKALLRAQNIQAVRNVILKIDPTDVITRVNGIKQ